jgi:hypothetical protein
VPRLSTAAMVAAAETTVAVVTAMVPSAAAGSPTVAKSSGTPIKHLVVIFQENVSFDHYFGTYPRATNSSGQPFCGGGHSGSVNNLVNTAGVGGKGNLLTNNPNRDATGKQVNPRRLDPANINDILTCDQDMGMRTNGRPSMVRPMGRRPRLTSHHERRHRQWEQPHGPAVPGQRCHELLRRQHGHRTLELREPVRDE